MGPINYTFCIFLCHYPVSSQKLGAKKTDHPVESMTIPCELIAQLPEA